MTKINQENAKTALRKQLKALRAGIPESRRAAYSQRIAARLWRLPEWQTARTAFAFVSYSSEVHTHDIVRHLLQEMAVVCVPRIIDHDHMLALRLTAWDQLQADKLGILAPVEGEVWNEGVDIAITPGLGFTEKGHRIGFGAGYYDKWFATHPCNLKVALAFEAQIQEAIPTDRYDIPVDLIITEKRLIDTRQPPATAAD